MLQAPFPPTGRSFTTTPMGRVMAAMPTEISHCFQLRLATEAPRPKNSTMMTWNTQEMAMIPKNRRLPKKPFPNTLILVRSLAFISLKIWQNTKQLKMIVFRMVSSWSSSLSRLKSCSPSNRKMKRTMSWNAACPRMFLHITGVTRGSCLPTGSSSMRASVGSSVPSARAPMLSMIMLTQRSCTGEKGGSAPGTTAPTKLMDRATTFTVSWKARNFWMLL